MPDDINPEGPNIKLDELDREILRILLSDARASYADIARELKVAESTVYNRLQKLIRAGVIEEFTLLVNLKKLGLVYAIFLLDVESDKIGRVMGALKRMEHVISVTELAGRYNVLAFGAFCDADEYGRFLNQKVLPIEGIRDVKASLTLDTYRPPPLKPSIVLERCPHHSVEFSTPSTLLVERKVAQNAAQISFSFTVTPCPIMVSL